MKKLLTVLALLCWHTTNAQEKSWLLQATSFSVPGEGYLIEPEINFTVQDEFSFHEFSLSASGNFSAINGINIGNNSPYIYMSYNPWEYFSTYTSIGVSRQVSFGGKFAATTYFEFGITNAEYSNWSLGAGMIYTFEFPNFGRKRR